jgi:hypothetical protein
MAITPQAGWQQDPNNPNGVVPVGSAPAAPQMTLAQDQTKAANQGKPGYDVLGNPLAGAVVSPIQQPINRSIDSSTGADPAETYLNTFVAPQSADQIAEGKRKQAQGLIDATNTQYDNQVADAKKAGLERTNQNNSISVMSGLMGSTEAARTDQTVTTANQKAVDAVNNQRAVALQSIYSKISSDASTEAEQQKQDAFASAQDIVSRRKDVQKAAVDNITNMAKTGLVDFESFKNSPQNAQVYQHALDSVGGSEDALKAIFAINRPQDSLVGTPTRVGDHFIQGYKNALTGTVSYDTINVPGLGTEYSSFQKMGDNLVAIPDGWNGDTSQLKTIAGIPSQGDLLDQQYKKAQIDNIYSEIDKRKADTDAASDPGGGQLYAGLKPATATAIRQQVSTFKTEPVVQNFAVVQEGRNFAGSLDNKTTNPVDDQGLIYALAKALDPGSVVREGEYATAQKYSQSWIQSYGKAVTQALAGTGFLTEQARRQIKDTIESKYKASLASYTNLQGQYEQGINSLTGRDDGSKFIHDYQMGSSGDQPAQSNADPLGLGI